MNHHTRKPLPLADQLIAGAVFFSCLGALALPLAISGCLEEPGVTGEELAAASSIVLQYGNHTSLETSDPVHVAFFRQAAMPRPSGVPVTDKAGDSVDRSVTLRDEDWRHTYGKASVTFFDGDGERLGQVIFRARIDPIQLDFQPEDFLGYWHTGPFIPEAEEIDVSPRVAWLLNEIIESTERIRPKGRKTSANTNDRSD